MSLVVCTKLFFFFFSPLPNVICLFCGIRCSVSKLSPLWPSFWFSTMERLKLVLQYFQSNSESISNGICIILALVSVKLYTSFDFNCPCLPQYNKLYSLGVMIVPPVILFFFGVLINRHAGVMMDEWMRPVGNRSKNPVVVKWVSVLIAWFFFFLSLHFIAVFVSTKHFCISFSYGPICNKKYILKYSYAIVQLLGKILMSLSQTCGLITFLSWCLNVEI